MHIKICGLRDPAAVVAAAEGGARYIGFVFFEKSPRYVAPMVARDLAGDIPPGICKVALVVNPDDAVLDALVRDVPLDMLQLHGSETPERVAEIRARHGLPVMKAIGVADADDLADLNVYAQVADQILVDAKPPKGAEVPGGNGVPFDWTLLQGRRWAVPWMLSGGLTQDNVHEAIRLTGAQQIDLSSGVERARGEKDPALIRSFLRTCNAAPAKT